MASPQDFIDGTNFGLLNNLLKFSKPRPGPSGGKVINIMNKNTNQTLNVVTPVITTWGAKEGLNQNKEPTGKWSVSLQFPNDEYPDEEASKFLVFLKKFEEDVKAAALKNSMDWLGLKNAIPQVIDVMFNAMLKYPKISKDKLELDYTKAPSLPAKLAEWKTGWQVEVFDEDKKPLFVKSDNGKNGASPLNYLSGKILKAKFILQPTIWITNSKVSITWNVVHALVKKPQTQRIPEGVCLLELSDNDKSNLETQIIHDEADVDPSTVNAMIESDDEGDDEEVLTQAPKPSPAPVSVAPVSAAVDPEPKKKKIVKKTT